MTRLRIVLGKLSIITHNNHNIYAREGNIQYNAKVSVIEVGEKNGTSYGKPQNPKEVKIKCPFLFFSEDGYYLAGPTGGGEIIYLSDRQINKEDEKTMKEWTKLKEASEQLSNNIDDSGLTYNDFKHFSATVLGESCVGFGVLIKDELYAFASANHNFKVWYEEKKNKAISYRSVISKTGAYAVTSAQYKDYMDKTAEQRNSKESMVIANAAVINAINGGFDHSQGAIKWSGVDMVSSKEKWREGYVFTNSNHDIFYLGNNSKSGEIWKYKWESRAAFFGFNEKLKNKWWDDYMENSKYNVTSLLGFVIPKSEQNEMDFRKAFFEKQTMYRFGTVFCRLTKDYINSQGGEFY